MRNKIVKGSELDTLLDNLTRNEIDISIKQAVKSSTMYQDLKDDTLLNVNNNTSLIETKYGIRVENSLVINVNFFDPVLDYPGYRNLAKDVLERKTLTIFDAWLFKADDYEALRMIHMNNLKVLTLEEFEDSLDELFRRYSTLEFPVLGTYSNKGVVNITEHSTIKNLIN